MANHFIRAGATGSADGSDWTNAFTNLPATLTRTDTYYVADGAYAGNYVFNDAESSTSVITIKKATVADHGTETGWLDSYGDGQAEFQNSGVSRTRTWAFEAGYYTLDGNAAVGSYGFLFTGIVADDDPTQGSTNISIGDDFSPSVNGLIFKAIEINCGAAKAGNGISINVADSLLFSNISIHNIDDDAFIVDTVTNSIFEYLHVYDHVWASGSTAHPDIFEIWGGGNFTVRYSKFDWTTTASTVIGFTFNERNSGRWDIYGNWYYGNGSSDLSKAIVFSAGFVYGPIYLYNNSFVLAQFALVAAGSTTVTGDARNNIFYESEVAQFYSMTHDYNWFFNSGGTFSEANAQTGSGDPFVNLGTKDFHLAAATNAGDTTIGTIYNTDDLNDAGILRGEDGVWDRGAHEFVATPPPTPLNITTTSAPDGEVSVPYLLDVDAGGGTTPYTFTLLSGSLPTGLTLASENLASTANLLSDSGNFAAAEPPANLWDGCLSATDECMTGNTGISSFFVEFDFGASKDLKFARLFGDDTGVWVSSTWTLEYKVLLGDGYTAAFTDEDCLGSAWFNQTLNVTGRYVKVTLSSTTGSTEARELEIYAEDTTSPNGVIVGTPTAGGTSNFTIRCTDSTSPTPETDDQALSIFIAAATTVTIDQTELPGATFKSTYSTTLTATGGTGPYTWTLDSGALPSGLSLSSAGVISGTVSKSASAVFTPKVTDAVAAIHTRQLTIFVAPRKRMHKS